MGDVPAMSEKIRLLSDNKLILANMSENAEKKANSYTMERMVKGYREVFLRMVE